MFLIEFVGMFMMYLHTEFDVPNSSGSLVIIVKLKDIVWIPYCFTFYRNNILKLHIFQRSIKKNSELLPTLEVPAAAMLVLLISGY
jgi:hypothetical protein